jgi:hypothetical protein
MTPPQPLCLGGLKHEPPAALTIEVVGVLSVNLDLVLSA